MPGLAGHLGEVVAEQQSPSGHHESGSKKVVQRLRQADHHAGAVGDRQMRGARRSMVGVTDLVVYGVKHVLKNVGQI